MSKWRVKVFTVLILLLSFCIQATVKNNYMHSHNDKNSYQYQNERKYTSTKSKPEKTRPDNDKIPVKKKNHK